MPRSRKRPAAVSKDRARRRAAAGRGVPVPQIIMEAGARTFTPSLRPEDNGWLSEDLSYDSGHPDDGWPFTEPPPDFAEAPWEAWLRAARKFRATGRGAASAMLAAESAPFTLARPGREPITTCLECLVGAVSDRAMHADFTEWALNQPRLADHGILRWDSATSTVTLTLPGT